MWSVHTRVCCDSSGVFCPVRVPTSLHNHGPGYCRGGTVKPSIRTLSVSHLASHLKSQPRIPHAYRHQQQLLLCYRSLYGMCLVHIATTLLHVGMYLTEGCVHVAAHFVFV